MREDLKPSLWISEYILRKVCKQKKTCSMTKSRQTTAVLGVDLLALGVDL
jgi:hypothetical protein